MKGVDGDGKMSLDEGDSRRSYDQEGDGLNITNFPTEPILCESFSWSVLGDSVFLRKLVAV